MTPHLTYGEDGIIGLIQGVTELFPISSLGHTVLFPTLFGWNTVVRMQSQAESPWLAFVVLLHVGSALGLLWFFRRDWVLIIRAFFATIANGTAAVLLAVTSVSAWSRIALARDERRGMYISSGCGWEGALNEEAEAVEGMRRL